MLYSFVYFFVGLTILVLACTLRRTVRDKDGHPIPPGPLFRLPFLRDPAYRELHEWSKTYGPLFSFSLGNQLFVCISDARIAHDLFITAGSVFSSRKRFFLKNEIILQDRAVTASPYDATWRQHRRLAMQFLMPKVVAERYISVVDYEPQVFVKSLFTASNKGHNPVCPGHFAARYSINIQMSVAYGRRTTSVNDPLIERIRHFVNEFGDLTDALEHPVEFFPLLRHLPLRSISRARQLQSEFTEVYGGFVQDTRKSLGRGDDVAPCVAKHLIENQAREKLSEKDIYMLTSAFVFGGIPSVYFLTQWFLVFMARNPHVVRRAHEELDRVVGRERWPTNDDEEDLPYLRAIVKEVERLNPPFWKGTPHYTSDDYVYNGTFIPKDTVVFMNCWSVHHDPERYPDPFMFNPERYLGHELSCADSSKLKASERDHWAFGAGRRICPGIALAERMVWLSCAKLLWAYDFDWVPGQEMPSAGHTGGMPPPIDIQLTPRDETILSLIEKVDERSTPHIF